MKRNHSKRNARGARDQRQQPARQPARTGAAMPRTAEGVVSANRAGFGFVRVEGQEDSVFLPPPRDGGRHARRSRAGVVERGRDGRYSGRLEKIIEHATKAFVGTMEVHGRTAFVTAADRRVGMRCLVAPAISMARAMATGSSRRSLAMPGQGSPVRRRASRSGSIPNKPVELASEAAIARFDLPRRVFARGACARRRRYGRPGRPRRGRAAHGSARPAARHHRRRGRQGFRRRGIRRAAPEGLPAHRRDCRCELLRAARHGARRQRARARHVGVFPDARDPDAAVRAVERVVLAAAARSTGCVSPPT